MQSNSIPLPDKPESVEMMSCLTFRDNNWNKPNNLLSSINMISFVRERGKGNKITYCF